jgi:hypothetical protein
MMNLHRLLNAVKHHLQRTGAFAWTRLLQDPRKPRGRRFSWAQLLGALWAGVLTAARNMGVRLRR